MKPGKRKVDVHHVAVALLQLASLASLSLQAAVEDKLHWKTVTNSAALCNDFTQAGFFHRQPTKNGTGKWIVYLESGAVCYSSETCNRRYFNSTIQRQESTNGRANSGYGDFDTTEAFRKYSGTNFVNPLMTSMQCFNNTRFFPNGLHIEGKDLFDRRINHAFADHGQVVIPYCSSDVWLGGEDGTRHENITTPCNCLDHKCFDYKPDYDGLQFTFRGKTIFQSVLRDMEDMYHLSGSATELILIGSSAGGVGAMNLAKWVVNEFPGLTVKVITDSAWFINFRDGINQQFAGLEKLQNPPSGEVETAPTSINQRAPSSSLIGQPSHVTTTKSHMISSSQMHSYVSVTPAGNIATPSPSIMTSSFSTPTPTPSSTASGSGSGSGDNNFLNDEEAMNNEEIMKRYAPIEFEANRYADDRNRRDVTGENADLLKLLKSHESCLDTSRGFPCCLSAQCLLSSSDPETNEPYFPRNVSLFVITSLYDVFILGRAIDNVSVYYSDMDDTPVSLAVEYLTLVGEYGGVMDNSLVQIQESGNVDLTFYVSQCFQHIYFATSTLWGEGGLLGVHPVQINSEIGTFR